MRRAFRILLRFVASLAAIAVIGVALVVWAYRLPTLVVPGQSSLALADVTVVK